MKKIITVSATDVFEYVKCPAFYKQAILAGKRPDECYHNYYRETVFKKGIDFEKSQIEELYFAQTERSLEELINDDEVSTIIIDPQTILSNKYDEILDLPEDVEVICTGRPDILLRDPDSMCIVPLEYKTSIRYYKAILCQLKHYCFLLQKYQAIRKHIGYLKTSNLDLIRLDLDHELGNFWEMILNEIVSIKFNIFIQQKQEFNISKLDLNWNKECKHCYFYQSCKKLMFESAELKYLPQIKNRRHEMLKKLNIDTIEKLASCNKNELWEKILKMDGGKVVFQRRWTIDYIVSKARALLKGKCIPLSSEIEKLELKTGDGIFDLEYISEKESPIIFSISLGIVNNTGELNLKNWFSDDPELSSIIVEEFYEFLEKFKIKRLFGWSIDSGDLPQLRKIKDPPQNIKFIDIYKHVINNFAFPTLSDRLKDISEYLFDNVFTKKLDLRNGLQAISSYYQFLETKNQEYKKKIIEYNNSDVIQTFQLIKWINEFAENQN
ncbi:MAG: TM0106 family RecB-like putative nuclease [Candidatus Helarchaeota archaeon]